MKQLIRGSLTRQRSFVFTLGILTAVAALTIDISLPAIPAMAEALATNLSKSQRIVGVFMIGMAIGQVPAGLLSDRVGRMPVLYVGMSIFAAAAIVAAASTDIDIILVARFAQGLGAAAPIVVSRAIVRDVAQGQTAAKMMSLMTMIFTAAPVIAPSIGALLVTQWDWRAPFIAIAVCGIAMLFAIRANLVETHTPAADAHPIRQLSNSVGEFFSHRQSVFALLLLVVPPAGFMSVIATSSALAMNIYGYSIQQYGLIFAGAGLSILAGSVVNRILVSRFDIMKVIGIGVGLFGLSAAQLLIAAWLNSAPFWAIWSPVCLFMFTLAIVASNSTVLALDPLPKVAGVASSIIGTLQTLTGAGGALLGAYLYDGSVRNSVIIMAVAGVIVVLVYLLKPVIVPGKIVRHPDELARD